MSAPAQKFDARFLVAAVLALGALFVVPPAFRAAAIALAIVLVVLAPLPGATRGVVSAIILGLATGVASINLFVPQIMQKHVVAEFGWLPQQFAIATFVGTIVTVFSSPLIGRLFDRQGVRRWAIISILLLSATLISLRWLTPNLWHLYLIGGLMPIIAAGTSSVAYSRVIARWFDKRRGQAFGAALAGVGVGGAVLGPTLVWVIGQYGWRNGYVSMGLLGLVLTLPMVLWLLRDTPTERGLGFDGEALSRRDGESVAARAALPYGMTGAETRRQPRFWYMLLAFVLMAFAIGGVMIQLVPILIAKGIAETTAAQALGALSIALIAGRAFAGFLMDRIFAPYVAAVITILPAIGVAMLAYGITGGGALISVMLLGLAAGAELDVIAVLVTRYFGTKAYSENYGWQYAAWTLGSGTAPLLTTGVYQALGTHTPVLWLYAALFVVSGVMVARLGPYPELAAPAERNA
jgi:MFS family permease